MIRKFRDPSRALDACASRPETTLLAGRDAEGVYWVVARRSGYRWAPWSVLEEDGRMVVREGVT